MPNALKILIMEDDMAMREIITHKLQTAGFNVAAAVNGKQGLELFEKEKPDMVVMDLMMPEMDGFGALEAIRKSKDEAAAKTPVIVLSNLWSNEDILRVQNLGVKEYLIKAYFTPEEILGKIKAALGIT